MRTLSITACVIVALGGDAAADRAIKLQVSSVFTADGDIPAQFTCDGVEQSPPLLWSAVPEGTRSIAILVSDPDASSGVFTHWVVTGIASSARGIETGVLPDDAVAGENSRGKKGWAGPCPPSGKHHYVFRVYALDTRIAESMTRVELRDAIAGHVLASGKLVGMYERH